MLTRPDGTPLPSPSKSVEVSQDAVLAVAFRQIDHQLTGLMGDGLPPLLIVTQLLEMASSLLSQLEPPAHRMDAATSYAKRFEERVNEKARERTLAPPTRLT